MRLRDGIEPHSPEWDAIRLKRLTSSYMHKLFVSGKSKSEPIGVGGITYIDGKIGEMLTNKSESSAPETDDVMRGIANEPDALARYVEITQTVAHSSLFFEFNSIVGGTTDGQLCYPNGDEIKGVIEIKCPRAAKHTKVCKVDAPAELKAIDPQYWHQIQSNMMICGAEFGDFISYNEDILIYDAQIRIVRIYPDMQWRKEFTEKISWIAGYMQQSLEKILQVHERNMQFHESVGPKEIQNLQEAIENVSKIIKT